VDVAGRERSFSAAQNEGAARAAVRSYRERMAAFAGMGHLDVWYMQLEVDELLATLRKADARRVQSKVVSKAEQATSLGELGKLTTLVDGQRRILDSPPLIEHVPSTAPVANVVRRYVRSLPDERRMLIARYSAMDWARKVVGVGSVGTDDVIVLLVGDSDADPLFLQVKEAQASVLEPYAGKSAYVNHGERVVEGQRLMQAASDIFLGWTRVDQRDYYVRQLRDMKASIPIQKLSPRELSEYASACGAVLAHAHARAADPVELAAYLGSGDGFDRALAAFAAAYADQNESDYAAFTAALQSGRLQASSR
jgi:uncharacterized protein (DUF2252 family)